MTTTYFLGSNTPSGFFGKYEHLLDARATILLGGAGTGKSSLMRKVESIASESGYDTEVYLCSSDVDSLDAVYIPSLNYAVMDGTSPHAEHARYPVTRHTVVNLLDNADKRKIMEKRDEIELCTKAKKSYFNKAYCNLKCAELQYLSHEYEYNEKILASTVDRVFKLIKSDEISVKSRLISAISNKGYVDFIGDIGANSVGIIATDVEMVHFIEHLTLKLRASNIGFTMFYNPLFQKPDALLSGDFIIANNNRLRSPDYSYILDSGVYDFSLEEKLISSAIEDINLAHLTHMSIEKYFFDAMDWSDINRKTETIISEIFP